MPSKSQKVSLEREPRPGGRRIGRSFDPGTSPAAVMERPLPFPSSLSGRPPGAEPLRGEASLPLHQTDGRNAIGETVRQIRKEKGITQEALARNARVDRTTVARIECGIFKSVSMEKLELIALAIGLDLKTLILRAGTIGESVSYRGNLSQIEFALDYPQDGFRILSHLPKQKEFFFGRILIEPHKTVASKKLPHPQQIYLHALEGKLLLTLDQKEFLMKPGECFAFSGLGDYDLYNPDQFKSASSLFITYPSFLAA